MSSSAADLGIWATIAEEAGRESPLWAAALRPPGDAVEWLNSPPIIPPRLSTARDIVDVFCLRPRVLGLLPAPLGRNAFWRRRSSLHSNFNSLFF